MTSISLKDLNLDEEKLTERLIENLSERLLTEISYDEDGHEWFGTSTFGRKISAAIKNRIDTKVDEIAEAHVLPRVGELVENVNLQKTNQWGEARGESLSFIEYLTSRADEYLKEPVDHNGKAKHESNGLSWSKTTTRVSHMIDKHLHYHISRAMTGALENANKNIVEGLKDAVNTKLAEIKVALDVKVE